MRAMLARRGAAAALPLALAGALGLALLAPPAHARPDSPPAAAAPGRALPSHPGAAPDPAPRAQQSAAPDLGHVAAERLTPSQLPPLGADTSRLRTSYDDHDASRDPDAAVPPVSPSAACDPADFTGSTGEALVRRIKAAATACVNILFGLTGEDARLAFREAQMTSVARALRDASADYPGDPSAGTPQLVLFLRAGYYVQWYHPDDVGPYGSGLRTAVRAGLDTFFASPRSRDVTDANGETLAEAVTLIDSAQENARYLHVVERLLVGYDPSWNASRWMLAAVNNGYTVTFRGHYSPEFVGAVEADPGLVHTLHRFAVDHAALLGTDEAYLTSNAGRELGRFLQHASLRDRVRPLAADLLARSAATGPTAPLWVGVAEMADAYDRANCSAYGTCGLQERLEREVLPVHRACGPGIRILAQQMTAGQLDATCASLAGQDAAFHRIVGEGGPVADDGNTVLEVVVFDSGTDYRTYAGAMYGIGTDNGGMYLEGDPAAPGNQARFIAYEADWLRPEFAVWNLNHEYTHYLDGRFTLYGDFAAAMATPTVWWVEGIAEYVSYSYRGLPYTAAMAEAARGTYSLSTLFDTGYGHGTARVYRWGYLAVRYLLERHPADLHRVLGHYRTGQWDAARTHLTTTVGTRYDADFAAWLAACAAGDCGTAVPECTGADTRALGGGCRRSGLAAAAGDHAYLYLYVPPGTARLTITSTGGTGDPDLYYSGSGWATATSYTSRSAGPGTSHVLTVTDPPAGYTYVSLHAASAFTGAAVACAY